MSYCTIKTCYCTYTYRGNSADEVESEEDLPKTTSRKHSTTQRTHTKYVLSLLMHACVFSFYLPTVVRICVKLKLLINVSALHKLQICNLLALWVYVPHNTSISQWWGVSILSSVNKTLA